MHNYTNKTQESCGAVCPGRTMIIFSGKRLTRVSSLCAPLFALKPMMWVSALSALIIMATMLSLVLSGDRFLPWSGIEQAIGLLIALTTLVVHEIGHAAAAVRHGQQPIQVGLTLHRCVFPAMFVDIRHRAPPSRKGAIAIALAGCMAQLLIAAILCLLIVVIPGAIGVLSMAALATVGLSLAQLIPCHGSDGEVAIAAMRSE